MICGPASMMVVVMPRWAKFSATSRPMNPPPMITAVCGVVFRTAVMASVSSILRSV